MPTVSVIIQDIRDRFQAFSDESVWTDEIIDPWLQAAILQVNVDFFGRLAGEAIVALTAHFLETQRSATATGGQITSVSAGDASVTYAAPSATQGPGFGFAATMYGRRYLELCQMQGGARVLVAPFEGF